MNEEIINDATMETATQETAPAETETACAGSGLVAVATLVGTMFLTTFSAMAGAGVGYHLFVDEEARAERKLRREARKAKRAEKKARKQKKLVVDDVTVEVNFDEEK